MRSSHPQAIKEIAGILVGLLGGQITLTLLHKLQKNLDFL